MAPAAVPNAIIPLTSRTVARCAFAKEDDMLRKGWNANACRCSASASEGAEILEKRLGVCRRGGLDTSD